MSVRRMSVLGSLGLMIAGCVLIASPALAKPKTTAGGGKCSCTCVAPTGMNGGIFISDNVYNAHGYSCTAFTGKTCNVNNPYTGGVATGEIIGCDSVAGGGRSVISVSPFGGAERIPLKRKN